MAQKDKERYKREMADYVPPSESEDESDSNKKGKGKKTTKKKKDPNAPKRGKSSFMFFSTEWRYKIKEENPDATFGELVSISATNSKCLILSSDVCTFFVIQGKLVGAKFKALSAEEKKPYEEMAEKDKARYVKEMAAYKQKSKEKAAESDDGSSDSDDDDDGVDDSDNGSDDSDSDSDDSDSDV